MLKVKLPRKNVAEPWDKSRKLTIRPIAANCTTETTVRRPHKTFQPYSLLTWPPPMATTKQTSVASSATVAKLMRKPVVRHMEQKYLSFGSQSFSSSGNVRQGLSGRAVLQ